MTTMPRPPVDSRSARKLIEKCFPQLQVSHSKQIVTGWENFVLEVNRKDVFRFPKCGEAEKHLRNDIVVLPALSRHLSTQVPDYGLVWKGGRRDRGWLRRPHKVRGGQGPSLPFR